MNVVESLCERDLQGVVLADLLGLEGAPRPGATVQCPNSAAHSNGDRTPSFVVGRNLAGGRCMACGLTGGLLDLVRDIRGLPDRAAAAEWVEALYLPDLPRTEQRETVYAIRDTRGVLVAEHVRRDGGGRKTFTWRRNGRYGLDGLRVADVPLYGAERLAKLESDAGVLVVEGERAADALHGLRLPVVATVTGAAGTPSRDVLEPLRGRKVCLWPDADAPGREHMSRIAALLTELDAHPYLVEWPDAPERGDAADLVAAGGGRDDVLDLLKAARRWKGARAEDADSLPLTDLGNAERLVRDHGADLLHCAGAWLVWDGRRWERDATHRALGFAFKSARAIREEAARARDKERAKALFAHALRSENAVKLKAAVGLTRPMRPARAADLDANPWLLNCTNGTLDLRTGELRPHRRDDRITRLAPVEYDPVAACPKWLGFLERTYDGNEALVRFVRRWFGHCLTGDTSEQYLPILWGEGANGKSVLTDTLLGILGDYAQEAAPALLVPGAGDHPTVEAQLMGARLVVASETGSGARLRLELVKRHTGNARVRARFMRGDYFEYERTHKLLLHTNHRPVVREDTEAAWRRILLVPHTVVIPPEERDPDLGRKLRDEWPGILRWLVEGCLAWQREGLAIPDAVRDATRDYRAESDPLGEWLDARVVDAPGDRASSASLWMDYQVWCEAAKVPSGERLARNQFGEAVGRRYRGKRTKHGRFYEGVRLATAEEVTE